MSKCIVITGNPVDGLFFYGPFDDVEEAGEWAEREHNKMDYWVAPMEDPQQISAAAVALDQGDSP